MAIDYLARQKLADYQQQKREKAAASTAVPVTPPAPVVHVDLSALSQGMNDQNVLGTIMTSLLQEMKQLLDEIRAHTLGGNEQLQQALTDMGGTIALAVKNAQDGTKKSQEDSQSTMLSKLLKELSGLGKTIKALKFPLPDIFPVKGTVSVDTIAALPPVHVENFPDMSRYFLSLEAKIDTALHTIAQQSSPPAAESGSAIRNLVKQLLSLEQTLHILAQREVTAPMSPFTDRTSEIIEALGSIDLSLRDLYQFESGKPTMVPPPITNINVNALNGALLTTQVTVSTTPVPLPTTPLANRRGIVVNNNSSQVLYVGTSTVSPANGYPVSPGADSPPMDAGTLITVYGVVSTGNADVRVLEISNTAKGI